MDELKIKVVQKQLDGSTVNSDVTFSDDNDVTSESSVVPGENSVVANPEIPAGTTPTDLETVQVGSDYYQIPEGVEVEANPTVPSGTTPTALTGIKIDSGYYDIPQGMEIMEFNSSSGNLTDDQISKLEGNNIIIKYDNYYYYKSQQVAALIIYSTPIITLEYDGVMNVFKKKFTINKSQKIYSSGFVPVTVANPTLAGTEASLTSVQIGDTKYKIADSVSYLTTAPSAANTSGRLIFVVLDSDPSTKYDGYLYIITGSNQ